MTRAKRYLPAFLVLAGLAAAVVLGVGNRPRTRASDKPAPPPVADTGDELPGQAAMERLARKDPIAFLENCLRRYQREVHGYTAVMQKQERVDGELQPKEVVEVRFRQEPHSVYMQWIKGAERADRVLYVEGENGGKLLAHPKSSLARKFVGDVVTRDEDNPDTKRLKRFGMKKWTERTLVSLKGARERGNLEVKYLGEVKVKEADDRPCWKLRWVADVPQDRGVTELTVYIDKETWLQVGTVMKNAEGRLVLEYFFRDLRLNPKFKPEDFERAALIP